MLVQIANKMGLQQQISLINFRIVYFRLKMDEWPKHVTAEKINSTIEISLRRRQSHNSDLMHTTGYKHLSEKSFVNCFNSFLAIRIT
jgi:hypothetical protein